MSLQKSLIARDHRPILDRLPSGIRFATGTTVASLIETCKLNDIDPLAYLTDALTRIVNGHPNRDIDQLLPWAYRKQELKAVA